MTDVESEIFTRVCEAIEVEDTGVAIYGETLLTPTVFPCVCIEETDNYTHTATRDGSNTENHVNLTYEVNIYSNKTNGKKSECKKLFAIVDKVLLDLGFNRTVRTPVTLDDSTKYRLFGRYTGIISTKDHIIYRR